MSGSSFQSLLMDGGEGGAPPAPTCVANPYYSCTNTAQRTVLVLHADSTSDDSCYETKVVTLTGAATVTTSIKKFGSGSFSIPNDGTSTLTGFTVDDSADFDLGADDFTLALWVYRIADTYEGRIFTGWNSNTFRALVGTDGLLDVQFNTSGGPVIFNNQATITPGQWYWLVLQRRNNQFQIWLDGVLINAGIPVGVSDTITSSGPLYFGRTNVASAQSLDGYLDEISLTKGVAQYTPIPALPYPEDGDDPEWANVEILSYFNGSGATLDNDLSTNNYSIVRDGNAVASSTQSIFGGTSLFIDGTTNNSGVTLVSSAAALVFGTGSFDVEVWVYPTQYPPSNDMVVITNRWATNSNGFSIQISTTGGISTTIGGSAGPSLTRANTVRLNEWNSIRLRRSGSGTTFLIVNGTTVGTNASVYNFVSAGPVILGWRPTTNRSFFGYIGAVRVTSAYRESRNYTITVPNLPNCNSTTADGQPINGTDYPQGQTLSLQQGNLRLLNHYQPLTGQVATVQQGFVNDPNTPVPVQPVLSYNTTSQYNPLARLYLSVTVMSTLTFTTSGGIFFSASYFYSSTPTAVTGSSVSKWLNPSSIPLSGGDYEIKIERSPVEPVLPAPGVYDDGAAAVGKRFTYGVWERLNVDTSVAFYRLFNYSTVLQTDYVDLSVSVRPLPSSGRTEGRFFQTYTIRITHNAVSFI